MINTAPFATFIVLFAWPLLAGAQTCTLPPRPLFEFQVDQRAEFMADSNVSPFPALKRPRSPAASETLVSFVVDTLGRPDTLTYKIVRDVEPGLAMEGRAVFARWRFRPAKLHGCAVPQLVITPLGRLAR